MIENRPRRRWAPIAAVGAVVLAAVVAGVALGTGLINLAPTADPGATPTPAPQVESPDPSTSPSPDASDGPPSLAYEPPPGVLPPSAIVTVNEPIQLREAAKDDASVVAEIEAGRRMRIIYGPLMVDGRRWYTLASTDGNDHAYGYAELDPSGSQVSLEPVTCPTGEPGIATLGPLSGWERLACNSDREIVLEGHEIVGFGGFAPGVYAPDWLNGLLGAFAIADPADPSKHLFVRVAPDGPDITRPQPSTEVGSALLRVTGHFNDGASTSCSVTELPIDPANGTQTADLEPIAAELICRSQFVVTEFEVVDEGTGEAPSLADLEVGSVVVPVVEGVTLRQDPGTGGARIGILSAGSQNIVVEGPVEADGFAWYRLAAVGLPPASGCITPIVTTPLSCPIWYGWAAAGNPDDGSAWFVATDVECPDPASESTEFLSLPFRMPLVCYGGDEITFTAFYPELSDDVGLGGACAADPSIAWLYCTSIAYESVWATDTYTGPQQRLFVDPDSGVALPERGQWLRITGSFDHHDSAGCAEANQQVGLYDDGDLAVLFCRTHFVVNAVEVTSAP